MYSILIRATFLVIVEGRMLKAKVDAKKHRVTRNANNMLALDMESLPNKIDMQEKVWSSILWQCRQSY